MNSNHHKRLQTLLQMKGNTICADCHAKAPRWASCNIGVFLCIRCAGAHRMLGVHISRVKSVTLDSWTDEQLAMMEKVGNDRACRLYEAFLPNDFERPRTDIALRDFVRNKYEFRQWYSHIPNVSLLQQDSHFKRRSNIHLNATDEEGLFKYHRNITEQDLLKDSEDADLLHSHTENPAFNSLLDLITPTCSTSTPIKENFQEQSNLRSLTKSSPTLSTEVVDEILKLYNK